MTSTRSTRSAARAASAAPPQSKRHKVNCEIDALVSFSLQGNRNAMEDTSTVLITEDGTALLFGVFDGHGGPSCSLFCKDKLCQTVANHPFLHRAPKQALSETFCLLDEEYCDLTGWKGAGSTATVAVFRQSSKPTKTQPAKYKLSVAWAGDSSAIIMSKKLTSSDEPPSCEQITNNHNGSRLDERRRIEKQGGYCEFDPVDKIYRVDGTLAVTRSLGDPTLKPHVCATPEVKEMLVEDGDLVIVASDGLWDYCDLDTIVASVRERGLAAGLQHVVEHAAKTGEDNVCAIGFDVGLGIAALQTAAAVEQE